MLSPLGQSTRLPMLTLIHVPVAETPSQHVRNALMLLSLLQQMSPATWHVNPELARATRRAEAALVFLEHNGPPRCAACHLRRAIETLLECNLDWKVVETIPPTLARLFAAWFALTADVEAN